MMITKDCSDYPDVPCCDSCHQDAEMGYDELQGYPDYYVCCRVMEVIMEEKEC